jgi:4-alpha-glucanotransferase
MVFGPEAVAQAMRDSGVADAFGRLEGEKLIDWPGSSAAKLALLRALFVLFLDGPDADGPLGADFASFRADGGDLLHQHATFEALHADRAPEHDWRRWAVDLRNPDSATVAAFAASRRHEVLFHEFLQWVTDRSLAAAQGRAREAGMRIGLVGDLAVGMDPTGSHAWSRQRDVLPGVAIGAPPDMFNPRGQDWGLTGFSPRALEDSGFAPFIATVRAVLRHAGGLRIDHAMGLSRLWLVPEGADPADGAYLAYPMTDLLRLLALESARHNAIVVGEDLGTVPAGFRETLVQEGVHGMRVMWFERWDDNSFAPASAWDPTALAMTTTHDLPTVAGWWHGTDIAARAACGRLGEGVTAEHASAERDGDRAALWQRFVAEGVAEGEAPSPDTPQRVVDAALAFVARTLSPLCLLPVEDLLGQEEQPNLPGTVDEHPNWRRRMPGPVDVLMQADATAARMASVAAVRPRK